MSEKKDVLDFPLEELEVPAAIKLMMGAATKCVTAVGGGHYTPTLLTDDERLLQLSEKLEARVEDALDAAKAVREEPVSEDAPNEVAVEESDIFLMEDGEVLNYKGVLFQKACNERVYSSDGPDEQYNSYCVKRWGHVGYQHEDMEGRTR